MTPSAHDPDLKAIADVRRRWVAAVAANNPSALEDLLTDDYEVWAHGAPAIHGPTGAVAAMTVALQRFKIQQSFEPIESVITGDWAFERGIESLTVTPIEGGPSTDMSQRALLILRRGSDGRWRYARGMTNGLPPTASPTLPDANA
jgi:uncharacterized protein (TIGR02246 family)